MRQIYWYLPVDRALHPFLVVRMPQSSILWLLLRDQEDQGDLGDLGGLAIPIKTTKKNHFAFKFTVREQQRWWPLQHSLSMLRVKFRISVVLTRIESRSGNPEPSMSTKVWNTLKSVVWFTKESEVFVRCSVWLRSTLTHRSESWSWGSWRSWRSPWARLTISTVSLYARHSFRPFLFYMLYYYVLRIDFLLFCWCNWAGNLLSFRSSVTRGAREAWRSLRTLWKNNNQLSQTTIPCISLVFWILCRRKKYSQFFHPHQDRPVKMK